ncbi:MAG: endonuclease V [Thermomicrobium sp.]|nr:endonuclease V [Thermomicrobium sp.]
MADAPDLVSRQELARLQAELARRIIESPLEIPPRTIAGADVHVRGDRGVAVAVCFELTEDPTTARALDPLPIREVERAVVETTVTLPYVPGFLSFREAPAIMAAIRSLRRPPDLLLVDGQGRAHPRRCGLASHVGILLDVPTIGVAKSRLFGRYREPEHVRGAWTPLTADSEVVGAAVRTRVGAKPIFVSVGHRITLAEAILWVVRLSRYRLPEPIRWAHRYAEEAVAHLDATS